LILYTHIFNVGNASIYKNISVIFGYYIQLTKGSSTRLHRMWSRVRYSAVLQTTHRIRMKRP